MTFELETYQNEYLPAGGSDVNAVVSVTATGAGPASAASATSAVVVIIDMSGSMQEGRKLASAKAAAKAAVDGLHDGVLFGIVAGNHDAGFVFPVAGLEMATDESRRVAKHAIDWLAAHGGTAIGRWLIEARDRLVTHEGAIRHAILLTDGVDESETREYLEAAVGACEGVFQCDCRGVGTNWRVDELRLISSRLLGTVDIVAEPEDMAADFEAIVRQTMAKGTGDVGLRLWTPRGASVGFVKQVAPTVDDLTHRAVRVDDRVVDYPTGAWGDEAREYHVHLTVPAQEVGDEMLAGKVGIVVEGELVGQSLIRAVWTDDVAASTRISPQVAHYTGQAELAGVIAGALEARAGGDDTAAAARFGRAAQLALETGHEETMRLLARVVDIVDAETGTVRLRRDVDRADEMALDTRSTRTVRTQADA